MKHERLCIQDERDLNNFVVGVESESNKPKIRTQAHQTKHVVFMDLILADRTYWGLIIWILKPFHVGADNALRKCIRNSRRRKIQFLVPLCDQDKCKPDKLAFCEQSNRDR